MSRSPENGAALASKALEIVLQHWLIPSSSLKGFDSVITELENQHLPDLKEKVIANRITCILNKDPQANKEKVEHESRLAVDHWRYFDQNVVTMLVFELNSIDIATDWLPTIRAMVRIIQCFNGLRLFIDSNLCFRVTNKRVNFQIWSHSQDQFTTSSGCLYHTPCNISPSQ